jgi:hypothetical protein
VAATLKKEPGLDVQVVDGNKGEFTVMVDRKVVAQKGGDSLPDVNEIKALVRNAEPGDDG